MCWRYKTVYFVKRDNVFKPFVTRKTLDTIEQECGDYQGNPISETTHRVIIWAKKVSEPK